MIILIVCFIISSLFMLQTSNGFDFNNMYVYSREKIQEFLPGFGTEWTILDQHPNGSFITGRFDELNETTIRLFDYLTPKIENSVTFTLFTREYSNGVLVLNTNQLPTAFNLSKPTKFITHGWMSSGWSSTCISIKNSYLQKHDVNVFIMDWSRIADNLFYFVPVRASYKVAKYYSHFLNRLIDAGANSTKFHLIGHSLGAHVSGFAARQAKAWIGRVTGLDPATLGYALRGSLTRSDALYVDVIHTCGSFLGLMRPIGHADYYPHGGRPPQPGCHAIVELIEGCSHSRSWQYFAESIRFPEMFKAYSCMVWGKDAFCEGNHSTLMAQVHNLGIFYVTVEMH